MRTTFIYGLFSDEDEKIRYVGKSDNPEYRLKRHIQQRNYSDTYKNRWINKMLREHKKIYYKIIEEVMYDIWPEREIYWIERIENLTNTSKGGLGGRGIKYDMSYTECKKWVSINMNAYSKSDWYKNIKNLPDDIPSNPCEVYLSRGWISWGDFLSTGKVQDNKIKHNYLSYDDAKKWILNNIDTSNMSSSIWKKSDIVNFIPNRPERFYKKRGWISWSDFLSNDNIQNQKREFLDFDSFISYFIDNRIVINNQTDWCYFRKEAPIYITSQPSILYKSKGWVNWKDFYKKTAGIK
jgi:hypothetical protein